LSLKEKGGWITNPKRMRLRENLYGNRQEMLNVKPWLPFLKGLNKPFPTINRRLDQFISCYLASLIPVEDLGQTVPASEKTESKVQ